LCNRGRAPLFLPARQSEVRHFLAHFLAKLHGNLAPILSAV
jgi:hypothetical protein